MRNKLGLKRIGLLFLVALLIWSGMPTTWAIANKDNHPSKEATVEFDTASDEQVEQDGHAEEQDDNVEKQDEATTPENTEDKITNPAGKDEPEGDSSEANDDQQKTEDNKKDDFEENPPQSDESTEEVHFDIQTTVENDFTYENNGDGTATITGYIGSETEIDIPDELNGLAVTRIGGRAFQEKGLTEVKIPYSVTFIGNSAFAQNKLAEIQIPDSVTIIDAHAFLNNELIEVQLSNRLEIIYSGAFSENKLTEISIPTRVETIASAAFSKNKLTNVHIPRNVKQMELAFSFNPLERITVDENNTVYQDMDQKGVYKIDGNTLIQGTLSGDIHPDTEEIGNSAFRGIRLTDIDIPNGVKRIGPQAFQGNELEQLTLPDSLETIHMFAFSGNKLNEIVVHGNVGEIAREAFSGNDLTKAVIFGNPQFGNDVFGGNPPELVLWGYTGTSVKTYAEANNHTFEPLDTFEDGSGTEEDPYIINTAEQLDAVRDDLQAHYKLGADIDLSGSDFSDGEGWEPIRSFSGTFDGNGYQITGLTIDRNADYQGLFGVVESGGMIRGVKLEDVKISGQEIVGALAGENRGSIIDSSVTGSEIYGRGIVAGGLVGNNLRGGTITNSYAKIAVRGDGTHVGGLVGQNSGKISTSYASGDVEARQWGVGGLVGGNTGSITESYATGNVSGSERVGGLVGVNGNEIKDSYATGIASSTESTIGGLVGENIGEVSIMNSYWNTSPYDGNAPDNGSGTPKTEKELQQRATFENWNFNEAWYQYEDQSMPFLQWQNPLVSWDVSIDKAKLKMDESATIMVESKHADDDTYDGTDIAVYMVDPAIVTIEDGIVTAESVGQATITITLFGYEKSINVEVVERSFDGEGDGTKDAPYIIKTAEQLDAVRDYLDAHFKLGADIDLAKSGYSNGEGWIPIGSNTDQFVGSFDGNGFSITGLTIDRDNNHQGLFGSVGENGIIYNVSLENVTIHASNYIGSLVGLNFGTIENSSVKGGSINGENHIGGLVGLHFGAEISSSFAAVNVSGNNSVGGLIGSFQGDHGVTKRISHSYASGEVTGNLYVGGLIGRNETANAGSTNELIRSYTTGKVTGKRQVGGLVGSNFSYPGGTIKVIDSYTTGEIFGEEQYAGGLIGYNRSHSSPNSTIEVINTYVTGKVTGTTNVGGLVGQNAASTGSTINISSSYWNISAYDGDTPENDIGTPKTEEELKQRTTFVDWDFDEVWYQYNKQTMPFLQWQNPITLWDVSINEDTLQINDTAEIIVNTTHENNEAYDGTNIAIYKVEPNIVTLENGIVTANKGGKAQITISLFGDSRTLEVDVIPAAPEIDDVGEMVNTETVELTGTAQSSALIQITGGSEEVSGAVDGDGQFVIEVPLNKNTSNKLTITTNVDGVVSEAIILTILHDDEKPQAPTITLNPKGWTNADEVHVTINQESKDENLGNVKTIRVKVGEKDWKDYDFDDVPIQLRVKTEGETFVQAQAVDQIGNKSETSETIVRIDRTAPTVTFEMNGNDSVAKEVSTKVTVIDEESGLENESLAYVWSPTSDTPPTNADWVTFENDMEMKKQDGDGEWYLHIQATDKAGNTANKSSNAFYLDNTPPEIEVTMEHGDNLYENNTWTNRKVHVSIEAIDDNIQSLQILLDGNDVEDIEGFTYDLEFAEDGIYELFLKAIDKAGNETTEERTIKIDQASPSEPSIQLDPEGWTNTEKVTVTITDGEDEENGSGVERTEYRIGKDDNWVTYEEPFNIEENGETTIYARTIDEAGNISDVTEATVKIKRTIPSKPTIEVETSDWMNADKIAVTITGEGNIEYQLNGTDGEWLTYAGSFDILDEGVTTIYARAVDKAGNTSQIVESTVRIDRTAPDLILFGNNPVNLLYGESYEEPGYEVTDNFTEDLTVDITGEVDTKKVGTYKLTYSTQDAAGNKTSTIRTVNVNDEEQPIITLKGDNPLILEVGTVYEEPGATAEDNVDGDISNKIKITGEVDTTKLGIYHVSYNVSDSSDNKAHEVTRTVEVVDTTSPEIILNGDSEIQLELGKSYNELGATATDNYDGDLTDEITTTGNVNTEQAGNYKIMYTVKDRSGNISSITRKVKVVDTTAPTDVELTATEITMDSVTLNFSAHDLAGIKEYILLKDGKEVAHIDGEETTFTDKDLQSGATYLYSIIAVDTSGNKSKEITLKVTTEKEKETVQLEEISKLPDIIVTYGTAQKDIPLPTEISVTLNNGKQVGVAVTWNKGEPTYDEQTVGTYTFTGEVTLPDGVINSGNKKATVKVVVNAPDTIEIIVDEPPILVYAGAFVNVKDTNTTIQLPDDLPAGTMLQVKSVKDIDAPGLVQSGEMYNFIFKYPEGEGNYTDDFILSMGVHQGEEDMAIYYYSAETKKWEHVGGNITGEQITATVNHFSTYGVFREDANGSKQPPVDKKEPEDDCEDESSPKPKDDNKNKVNNTSSSGEKQNNKDGETLPNTATNMYNWLVIGFLLIFSAIIIWQVNRRKLL